MLRPLILAAVALLTAFVLLDEPARASIAIQPDTTLDDLTDNGNCTLREAIKAAKDNAPVDLCIAGGAIPTVQLSAGTYELSVPPGPPPGGPGGDLDIVNNLTIVGAGPGQTIIDANGIDQVFRIQLGAQVSMTGLTITGGEKANNVGGGAMWIQDGSVTLNNVAVTGNGPTAALANNGTLRILSSAIANNLGVGVFNGGGDVLIEDSVVRSNGGTGVFNRGAMTVRRSLIAENDDFGMENDGIEIPVHAELENVTISGNAFAGFRQTDDATGELAFVTIAGNGLSANGLAPYTALGTQAGTLTVSSSIAFGPTGATFPNCAGAITSLGYNIDGGTSCGFTNEGDQQDTDPRIAALANNLGPTLTHALLEDSPAIDAADDSACPAMDQRGLARPSGHGCDAGAFESPFEPPAGPLQGDVNCDGVIGFEDFSYLIEFSSGLSSGITPGACLNLGDLEELTNRGWGDVRCDDNVGPADALFLIAYLADILLEPAGPCYEIGTPIEL